jgi:hypothetical protein
MNVSRDFWISADAITPYTSVRAEWFIQLIRLCHCNLDEECVFGRLREIAGVEILNLSNGNRVRSEGEFAHQLIAAAAKVRFIDRAAPQHCTGGPMAG